MRLNEALLESFTAAGLALDDAARAAYALQAFALGSIALESAEVDVEADAATSEPLIMTDAPGAALWTDLARFPLSEQTAVVAARAHVDRAIRVGRRGAARRAARARLSATSAGARTRPTR